MTVEKRVNMISLIRAYSKNKVIGNQGIIPWRIKGDS